MTPKNELSSSAIDAMLNEFETKLDRLYRQYEQYFIGIEKRPPRHPRREVSRMYRELEQLPMIKTSLKFRFRSLVQRFNSYKTYWNRVERQIEEGTYHRDLARAKARKQRRDDSEQAQQELEASGRSDDGAFELDDLDLDFDLGSMEEELQQMDQRGEFEKYVGTKKVKREGFPEDHKPEAPQPRAEAARSKQNSSSWQRPQVDEDVKQQRLAELQAKLGLSSRSPKEPPAPSPPSTPSDAAPGAQNPFDRSAEGPTQKARPENPTAPSRGADVSKLRRLRRAKERLERERTASKGGSSSNSSGSNERPSGPNRVIRRGSSSSSSSPPKNGGGSGGGGSSSSGSDDHSRRIYNNLVEAKRRCKEDTSNLNYDTFKRSMDRQRSQIQKKKGAREVDFKVVIKEGRAFLKPETKD